jgi:hypothetical protein
MLARGVFVLRLEQPVGGSPRFLQVSAVREPCFSRPGLFCFAFRDIIGGQFRPERNELCPVPKGFVVRGHRCRGQGQCLVGDARL